MTTGSVSAAGWVTGISFSVAASVIGGASKLAIRKSWLMEADESRVVDVDIDGVVLVNDGESHCCNNNRRRATVLSMALRYSGMLGMTVLNPLCGVIAMNYASPSITAPFSGLTLVWIVLFSDCFIGERPTKTQIVAATLIVLGEVIVAVWGDHTNDDGVTLKDVKQSYTKPGFVAFCIAFLVWFGLLVRWIRDESSPTMQRFAWGSSGGSITGFQNFLKDSLIIVKGLRLESQPPILLLAVLIVLAAGSAFGGLLLLTACMKRYDATYSSAMFVGSFVVSASLMSATKYDTFHHLDTGINLFLYPAGLVTLITGVCLLVSDRTTATIKHTTHAPNIERMPNATSQQQYEELASKVIGANGSHIL